LRDESQDIKKTTNEFVKFLEDKGLVGLLPQIVKFLEYYNKEQQKQDELLIRSQRELDAKTVEQIRDYIGAGKEVAMQTKQDATLKGGFVAQYKNVIYDASVTSQLQAVKKVLTQ